VAVAGQVALAVGDLARSVAFHQALGFALAAELGDVAAFLAFEGADRRLVLVRAASRAPAPHSPDRRHLAVRYPAPNALDAAVRRLSARHAGIGAAALRAVDGAVYLRDPDGHRLALDAIAGRSVWPRESSAAVRLVRTARGLEALFAELERSEAMPSAAA